MSRREKGKEDLTAARPVFRFLATPAIVFDVDALRKSVKRNDSLEVAVKPGSSIESQKFINFPSADYDCVIVLSTVVLLRVWNRSGYSFACLACCPEFCLLSNFCLSGSFYFISPSALFKHNNLRVVRTVNQTLTRDLVTSVSPGLLGRSRRLK